MGCAYSRLWFLPAGVPFAELKVRDSKVRAGGERPLSAQMRG